MGAVIHRTIRGECFAGHNLGRERRYARPPVEKGSLLTFPGGGSVMLQDMAYGGSLGQSLFVNVNGISPERITELTTATDHRRFTVSADAIWV